MDVYDVSIGDDVFDNYSLYNSFVSGKYFRKLMATFEICYNNITFILIRYANPMAGDLLFDLLALMLV